VSRYQKGKTNLNFTEARDSEWQCRQLGHMQVCTSLQTDNHRSVFYRPDALHHHHLFAQYAEMNSKICNVPDRKANSFSPNNCP